MLQPYLIQDSARVAPEEVVVVEPNPNHSPLRRSIGVPVPPSGASDLKMFDLSWLVLKSAWKQGVLSALPAVLVITFLAFPIVSALVRPLWSNPPAAPRCPSPHLAPHLAAPRAAPRRTSRHLAAPGGHAPRPLTTDPSRFFPAPPAGLRGPQLRSLQGHYGQAVALPQV